MPREVRIRVLQLAQMGVKPCAISQQMRITHGCISKLLAKFEETGSIDSKHERKGRPKVITSDIELKIDQYRSEQPGIFTWELRERLIKEGCFNRQNAPSLTSISRFIKEKLVKEATRKKIEKVPELKFPTVYSTHYNRSSTSRNNSSQCGHLQSSQYSVAKTVPKSTQLQFYTQDVSAFKDLPKYWKPFTLKATTDAGAINDQDVLSFDPVAHFEDHYAAFHRRYGQRRRHNRSCSKAKDIEKDFQFWFANQHGNEAQETKEQEGDYELTQDAMRASPHSSHVTCRSVSTAGPSRFYFPPKSNS